MDSKMQARPTRKAPLAAVGAVVAALASQHHLIHQFILLAGLGSAGMSVMSTVPLFRRGMLLMSLIMGGITLWQMWRWRRNRSMVVLGGISVLLTCGLLLWSILQFGF